ncbi:MAG: hypothetical protein NT109_08345 [Flavobacteriia bacterium]|nr:hypothetical protein [Flavobacteriia bacterium]
MNRVFYLFILIVFFLSSCIELIDDLTIHNDGSGTFKYIMNLSSSKIKVNSILALDSIDGKKVPSMAEIKTKLMSFAANLKTQPGISNVSMQINDFDLIVNFSCDFKTIGEFQSGFKSAITLINKDEKIEALNESWVSWDGRVLKRNIPILSLQILEGFKEGELDLLKTGSYTSINRFDRPIEKAEKLETKLNPAKTASMLRVNTFELQKNHLLIENTIYLTPIKIK